MSTALVPIETTHNVPDDDLPDTVQTPPEALAPLPEVTLNSLMDGLRAVSRALDGAFDKLPAYLETHAATLGSSLHGVLRSIPPEGAAALQHLCENLDVLVGTAETPGKGLTISGAPYVAQISAKTPGGYAVSIAIQRTEGAVFLESLQKLQAWLIQAGYTPAP